MFAEDFASCVLIAATTPAAGAARNVNVLLDKNLSVFF
jgi:hypothetical protein